MANVVTGEQYYELDGQLCEIKRQLRQSNGYKFNVVELRAALQKIIEGEFSESQQEIIQSFQDVIRAGKYNSLYGFANTPDEIMGQTYHPVTNVTELRHPSQHLTIKQGYKLFGRRMADLSEFLHYGMDHPNGQSYFKVGIIWKDKTEQFWSASINGSLVLRQLRVSQCDPSDKLDDSFRFLVRK